MKEVAFVSRISRFHSFIREIRVIRGKALPRISRVLYWGGRSW